MGNEKRRDAAAPGSNPPHADGDDEPRFEPRTPLGRKLWALRQQIVASGAPLLTADEIDAELAEQRRDPTERDG